MRLLGRGGMGEIYLARDTKLGRKVALKVVHPRLLGSEDAIERFKSEARITAKFDHPNIVSIYDVGDHQGRPYLTLAYLEGENLHERAKERRPSVQESIRFGLAIARALEEAHRHGILHRDLKPANVVIARDGRLRVLDFGLAKALPQRQGTLPARGAPEGQRESETPDTLTGDTSGGGTPAYMAPEQWREAECSQATDIWALGVILFELLAGRRPYVADNVLDYAVVVSDAAPAPPVDDYADVPADLAALVAGCLGKDPTERPTAGALVKTLERMLGRRRESFDHVDSPFRGLLPFTEQHVDLFFGREPEIVALNERLRSEPVVAVVGPSGAGKSSLIQAGVIPRLREQEPWVVLPLRPGAQPFVTLATRLARREAATRTELTKPSDGADGEGEASAASRTALGDARELAARLRAQPRLLSLELRALAEATGAHVLLFVDQLEELFTLQDDDLTRRAFMEAICTAADDPTDPVRVVFTVRDDYLGRLATGPEARDALTHVTVLQSLGARALAETLTEPVEAAGYRYEDPELVDQMVAAVRGEPAGLPLLQFAALLLWERRDTDRRLLLSQAYAEMGGVGGALAKHADGVLQGLSPAMLRLARELLLRLVTPERTRQVVARSKLVEALGEEVEPVLARLTKARLITIGRTSEGSSQEGTVELAHESLTRSWRILARWIDESNEEHALLNEVGQAAELWHKRGRRPEELWQGGALRDAQRLRQASQLPKVAQDFVEAGARRRFRRIWRRRGAVAGAMGVLGIVSLVLAVQKRELAAQQQEAETQRAEALSQRAEAQRRRAEALREGARAALRDGRVLEARAKLRVALELEVPDRPDDAKSDGDSAVARALWWRLRGDPLVWSAPLSAHAYVVAFAPDGQTIASACQDGGVHLLDTQTRQSQVLRGHDDQVFVLAYSPVGGQLASGSVDGAIRLWDPASGAEQRVLRGHESALFGLAFSPDGKLLASGSSDKTVRLWDASSGKEQRVLRGHQAGATGVSFSPDGKLLASTARDNSVRLWEVATGETLRVLRGHEGMALSVRFSPDGKLLASCGGDKTVRLWTVATGKQERVLQGHTGDVWGVSFSPDGSRLATASSDHTVRLWDVTSGQEQRVIRGHRAGVVGVAFSPDGKRLASGSDDDTVRLWDVTAGTAERVANGHGAPVYGVRFSPNGEWAASGGNDETVRLWDVASGAERRVLRGHSAGVWNVSFSPDGKLLASAARDRSVRLWDVASGVGTQTLSGHRGTVTSVTFSPDGKLLASGSDDRTARLWDVASGTPRQVLTGHTERIYDVAFSPDGGQLASASNDKTVRLWAVSDGGQQRTLTGHAQGVWGVDFSPDGERLLSCGTDEHLRIWDVAAGTTDQELGPNHGRVYACAFHPDGRRVAATSSDGKARIWDRRGGEPVVLAGHRNEVNAVALSASGELALTGSDDGTVRLWDVDTGKALWRGPALVSARSLGGGAGRPRLLSHRGWAALDSQRADGAAPPEMPATGWRQAVEQRAAFVSEAPDAGLLCIHGYDHSLELWDLSKDERLRVEPPHVGRDQVLAFNGGCMARLAAGDAGQATVLRYDRAGDEPQRLSVDGRVTALGVGGGTLLVAAGPDVWAFDERGVQVAPPRRVGVGVTALALRKGATAGKGILIVGYGDGNIELWPQDNAAPKLTHSFERVPSSPVLRIVPGPRGTVVVGFAGGLVGLWNQADGILLEHARLHGAVQHLLLENQAVFAATDLGQSLVWDLSVFQADRCALLRQIWERVPVVWERGRAVERPPPSNHHCLAR
ncbi:MAG: protein kinase [Deltaproteobacteria bacterium]|nr:protein kinase [Deltaproteobacteria bacterium]